MTGWCDGFFDGVAVADVAFCDREVRVEGLLGNAVGLGEEVGEFRGGAGDFGVVLVVCGI
jgi:hypothetical protein